MPSATKILGLATAGPHACSLSRNDLVYTALCGFCRVSTHVTSDRSAEDPMPATACRSSDLSLPTLPFCCADIGVQLHNLK